MASDLEQATDQDQRQRAIERKLGNWSVQVLILLGVWLLVSLPAPSLTGYEWLARMLGGPEAVSRFFLGFLFLYFAGIVKEKNHLRETLHAMVEMIKKHLAGRAQSSVAEAVQILVQALSSEDPETRQKVAARLQKLTGQDLGDDQEAWESWWKANKDSLDGEP
jgi:hypothetical protein